MDKNYMLVVFDVDGTLTTTKSGATFRKQADDWQWLPDRLEKLAELRRQHVRLAVATNQDGVAFEYMLQEDILRELMRMCQEANISVAGLYICYTHPKATNPNYRLDDIRRKPDAGMLLEAMEDFETSSSYTLYVGDRPEDEQAAKNAGCDFMWADAFFAPEPEPTPNDHPF